MVLAKVAGLDRAEYGIDDVEKHPLLFEKDGMLIATSKLTNFATGRYGPQERMETGLELYHWPHNG